MHTVYNLEMQVRDKMNRIKKTSHVGVYSTLEEIEVAKNYLTENEMTILNRIVSAYLELAELQALNRKPMYMKDWIERLDDFLKMTGNEILQNTGEISHKQAVEKAQIEYEKYKEIIVNEISSVEQHFIEQIETSSKKIETKKRGK
jgi:hypothetical protein